MNNNPNSNFDENIGMLISFLKSKELVPAGLSRSNNRVYTLVGKDNRNLIVSFRDKPPRGERTDGLVFIDYCVIIDNNKATSQDYLAEKIFTHIFGRAGYELVCNTEFAFPHTGIISSSLDPRSVISIHRERNIEKDYNFIRDNPQVLKKELSSIVGGFEILSTHLAADLPKYDTLIDTLRG
ncbi:MAG: hypothetical protein KKF65_04950 [Nanoarchaeota archaeon]|nr:hypothetical protein [Nanoarchaeota archaeon]